MKNFQISRLQLFEMKNELFADTVVISHHEKLFIKTGHALFLQYFFARWKKTAVFLPVR